MKKIVSFILVLTFLLTGCSILDKFAGNSIDSKKTDSGAGVTPGPGSHSGDGADAEDFEIIKAEDLEVTIVDTPPELIDFPSRSIGNATFNVETSKRATTKYAADGKAQSISVTDASGIEWTLEIPENALKDEEEISITPLNNVKLDSYPGTTLHGVLLEPDGLEFVKSSSITVKKAGEALRGVILSSEHDGTEAILSPAEAYEKGIKAPVQHFSTILLVPGGGEINQELEDFANIQYEMALEAAERLLEKPISVPAPPSIVYKCNKEEIEKQASAYAELVCREEEEMAKRIISAHRSLTLLFDYTETLLSPVFYQLLHRANAKVQMLKEQYEPQHEKFLPVFAAAIRTWRETSLFIETPELSTFLIWAQKTRQHYMDKLNKEHDYKAFGAAIYFDRICLLIGGDSMLESIKSSLTFKVVFENIVTADTTTYKVEGEVVVSFEGGSNNIFAGEGQGKYTGFSCPEPDLSIDSNTFPVKPIVWNFNPCDSEQIYIHIDRFGPDNETYIAGGVKASGKGVVNSLSKVLFEEYRAETNIAEYKQYHVFPMTLNNESEIAAEKTFKETLGDAKVEYTLKLVHAPR